MPTPRTARPPTTRIPRHRGDTTKCFQSSRYIDSVTILIIYSWRPAIPLSLDFPLAYLSGLQGIDWSIAAGHFHSYADTRRSLPFVCSSSRSLPPVCRSDNRHLARLISHIYPPEGWGSSYQLIRSDVGCLATGDEVDLPPLARANTPQWR